MIITRTPFRISFFGGGTDYPDWFRENGGAVLATSIDKYCYLSVRHLPPFFEHKHRIVYSKVETVRRVDEIQHPVVRALLSEMVTPKGVEIHHDADLPARSGLGSSSSFTAGLINALSALEGRMISKMELAREAIRIEQDVLRENVGCQDQLATAFGGFNRISFLPNGTFDVVPMLLPKERLELLQGSLMLFFTGLSRYASKVAGDTVRNLHSRESELRTMRVMVDRAIDLLQNSGDPVAEFGRLLHENWTLKRALADTVSTPAIDDIYAAARDAGAVGGKLLGAGGGGFILFVVPRERRSRVRERLGNLIYVNFRFEMGGSKVLIYEPDQDD